MALSTLVAAGRHAELPTDTPEATIATLHAASSTSRARSRTRICEQRYRALEPLIKATHDLPYIAEFALRRQWAELSEPDRARYVAAFERLEHHDVRKPLQERHGRYVQGRQAHRRSTGTARGSRPRSRVRATAT